MTPFSSILVATDFSLDGNNAVRRAAQLAHEHSARLRLLHVVDPAGCKALRDWFRPSIDIDLKTSQARESMRRFVVEIAGRYDVTTSVEVVVGDPLQTLMQASERAEMLILGRQGLSRFKSVLVGGITDRMLRTCRGPVLVVKAPVERTYRCVLVPVDFTPSSESALQAAARLTRSCGLHVFHAIDPRQEAVLRDADVPEHVIRESRLRQEAGASARMRRMAARSGLDSTGMGFMAAHGPAVRSTLRHAQWLGADLIVTGKQGKSTLGRFLLGSVSSRILTGASCDILIVPRHRDETCARADNAAHARDAAALAGSLTPAQWPERAERHESRRLA